MRLIFPLLLILGGCASAEYEGVEHLRPHGTLFSVQKEQKLDAALGQRQMVEASKEVRRAHAKKMLGTSQFQPSYLLPHEKGH